MIIVFTTLSTLEQAETIAALLVQKKLVACCSIIPSVLSVYMWEENLCKESEIMMICKTDHTLESALYAELITLHPYSCPMITTLTPSHTHSAFLNWMSTLVPNPITQ